MFKGYSSLIIVLLFLLPPRLEGQTPTDGLMMARRDLCTVVQFNHTQWDQYWEGDRLRSNANFGTIYQRQLQAMSAFGISDRLNALISLPWVQTGATNTYLNGQRGIQDLSVWLKWRLLNRSILGGSLQLFTTGGLSSPVTDYVADYMPLNIGMQSRTSSLRLIAHYQLPIGIYSTAQAGHTWRSNVEIDRNAFIFFDKLYYTNNVPVPNLADATLRLGLLKSRFQVEGWLEGSTGLSGDDMRYNEAPFLTNKMQAITYGFWGRYWIGKLAVSANYGQVLSGRNVGKATSFGAGIFYLVHLEKKEEKNEKSLYK
ncbi:MAG: hypothetical protein ACK5SQ_02320 [Chitinophagales bacterium]